MGQEGVMAVQLSYWASVMVALGYLVEGFNGVRNPGLVLSMYTC